jgi:hypothetical protein
MLNYDEKRSFIRMEMDCDITYKLADSDTVYSGRCSSISGAGVSFISDCSFGLGKAMEINVTPKSNITPSMTAFIEVIRSTQLDDGNHEIAATIKSIKGS